MKGGKDINMNINSREDSQCRHFLSRNTTVKRDMNSSREIQDQERNYFIMRATTTCFVY